MAGLSTVLGSIVVFFKIKKSNINKFITFCLAFSLSIMISISIGDLILNSSINILSSFKLYKGITICIMCLFIGFISIKMINYIIDNKIGEDNLYKIGVLSMLALLLHNLPEGIATFMSSYKDINLGIKLSTAIMLHNIPEGICIAMPIYYSTKNKKEAVMKTLFSGLAEPIGALIAWIFLAKYINNKFISIVLLIVAGIMISLSINKLFPAAKKYHEDNYLLIGLCSGVTLVIINILFF